MIEPASFFQSMIEALVSKKSGLAGVRPEWIRQVTLKTNNCGSVSYAVILLHIPLDTRANLNIMYGSAKVVFQKGKPIRKEVRISIRLSD